MATAPAEEVQPKKVKTQKIRRIIGDLFTFVRSQEANLAVQKVTIEQLLQEQIKRNGDQSTSNAAQYNPYSHTPGEATPATSQPLARANYLGGSDVTLPTKLDRVLALKNEVESLVKTVKALSLDEINAENNPDADEDKILDDNPVPLSPEGVP